MNASTRRIVGLFVLAAVTVSGCSRQPEFESGRTVPSSDLDPATGGAVSMAPVAAEVASRTQSEAAPARHTVDWSPLELQHGTFEVSCQLDHREQEDDAVLTDTSSDGLRNSLDRCSERGVMRLRYRGRIDSGFATVIERITVTADALGIRKRVLSLDSAGGQIEDAIRAGDFIAESHWSVWVREDAICHSACLFILAAGDTRMIAGQVGIHRIMRMSSTATTRAQLNDELQAVYRRVRAYLERNGAAPAVADLMMAVPNRSLRLLSHDELQLNGLDGANPAQDDLDRLRLMRECGKEFVARRDSFARAFERECSTSAGELREISDCGLKIRQRFGFPGSVCPSESPFAEFDVSDQSDASEDRSVGEATKANAVESGRQEQVARSDATATDQAFSVVGASDGSGDRGRHALP